MYELYDVVSKQAIFQRTNQEEIFKFYYHYPKIGGNFKSPFHKDEKASCSFYRTASGIIHFKDFSSGFSGDCFSFVAKKFGLSFKETLDKIYRDMSLGNVPPSTNVQRVVEDNPFAKEVSYKEFNVEARPFNESDYKYWAQFGITRELLIKFSVFAVQNLWIGQRVVYYNKTGDPAYAYKFDKGKFKVYFPFRRKKEEVRFYSNYSGLQGLNKLPETGYFLCLTKSYKDVMLLDRYQLPAVAPSSETNFISLEDVTHFRSRFGSIFSLFDFDRAGVTGANRLRHDYGIPALFLTNGRFNSIDFGSKDPTDLYQRIGREKFEKWINILKDSLWNH